jgi:hypothetical protein
MFLIDRKLLKESDNEWKKAKEELSLSSEHCSLVTKEFSSGLIPEEKMRLNAIRVLLDRFEAKRISPNLDRIEARIDGKDKGNFLVKNLIEAFRRRSH